MLRDTRAPILVLAFAVAAIIGFAAAASAASSDSQSKSQRHAGTVAHNHRKGKKAIDWGPCKSATAKQNGFQCATVVVPKDYGNPSGGKLRLAVTRLPAIDQKHKVGPLFVNYGGPGGDAVSTTQRVGPSLFGAFTDRFDLVAVDPRGVGESEPSIDCKADQRREGIYSIPFTDPENVDKTAFRNKVKGYVNKCVQRNRKVLPYVSTANVARDMDNVRGLMNAKKLNYFGFSYGTFLGATYVSMFPNHYRTAVLDGALDAQGYINDPMSDLREQTAGFERELGRYFQACAAHLDYCSWVRNGDPEGTYDDLVESADAKPLSVADPTVTGGDTTPVSGDDINNGAIGELYAKQLWGELTASLNQAAAGDGTFFRALSNASLGVNPDGADDPGLDRYFTIGASEQNYGGGLNRYLEAGASSYRTFDHFWFNSGYPEFNYAKFPIDGRDLFNGPFDAKSNAATPLVVGTKYDPATVYRQAKSLTADLGNARLLTMNGDGHTAYGGNSQCIDDAVNAYVNDRVLPATGTTCDQQVPFPEAEQGLAPKARKAKAQTIEQAKLKALKQTRPSGK